MKTILELIKKVLQERCGNFYHINLPTKYFDYSGRFNNFDTTVLYESYIYKNTNIKNIWKEIENDNIKMSMMFENTKKQTLHL